MPAIPLVLILFGYIMRMARVGTVEALESDYARTATLKGLPRGVMIRRHVLRNSLLPTITVIATQTGYLIGGLVVVETLFRYQGIGSLVVAAATNKDFPMLEAGVLTIGIVYMLVDADRRRRVLAAQSANSAGGPGVSVSDIPVEDAPALRAGRSEPRGEILRQLVRRPRSSSAAWFSSSGSCARHSARHSRRRTRTHRTSRRSTSRRRAPTGSAPMGSVATCSRASSSARGTS